MSKRVSGEGIGAFSANHTTQSAPFCAAGRTVVKTTRAWNRLSTNNGRVRELGHMGTERWGVAVIDAVVCTAGIGALPKPGLSAGGFEPVATPEADPRLP